MFARLTSIVCEGRIYQQQNTRSLYWQAELVYSFGDTEAGNSSAAAVGTNLFFYLEEDWVLTNVSKQGGGGKTRADNSAVCLCSKSAETPTGREPEEPRGAHVKPEPNKPFFTADIWARITQVQLMTLLIVTLRCNNCWKGDIIDVISSTCAFSCRDRSNKRLKEQECSRGSLAIKMQHCAS